MAPLLDFAGLLLFSFSFSILARTCNSLTPDTINPNKALRDEDTLVSPSQTFELGFFSPSDPKIRYLGLWYRNVSPRTIVWVANRDTPLHTLGSLVITKQGILVLVNSTNHTLWSSTTSATAEFPVAQLLDSGNLVVREAYESNPNKFLWQSFHYPQDTLLPEMKLGTNLITGHETFLSSWRSTDNPAPGSFSVHLDIRGYPQVLIKKENRIKHRVGSWSGLYVVLSGGTQDSSRSPCKFQFISNHEETYLKCAVLNSSILVKDVINPSGILQSLFWSERTNGWEVMDSTPQTICGNYAYCGSYAKCDIEDSPICSCLEGFMPRSPKDWNMQIFSDGCARRIPLNCSNKDGFLKQSGIKVPETSSCRYKKSTSPSECESLCLRNCSCTAYAILDVSKGGNECLLWFNELIDTRKPATATLQDIYVRVAASELAKIQKIPSYKKKVGIIAGAVIVVASMPLVFYLCSSVKMHTCGFVMRSTADRTQANHLICCSDVER